MDAAKLDQLFDSFTGDRGVVADRLLVYLNHEKKAAEDIEVRFGNMLMALDCLQDFLLHTCQSIAMEAQQPGRVPSSFYWALSGFVCGVCWPVRASTKLIRDGYASEAGSLMRGAFEVLLDIVAVRRGIVVVEDFFPKLNLAQLSDSVQAMKEYERLRQSVIKRLQDRFFGQSSPLNATQRRQIRQTVSNLHRSVHRSLNAQMVYLGRLYKHQGLPLLPDLDGDLTTMSLNFITVVGAIAVLVAPQLQRSKGSFGTTWLQRQTALDATFTGCLSGHPKDAFNDGWMAFIKSNLVFDADCWNLQD